MFLFRRTNSPPLFGYFISKQSHLFSDQIEFLKIIACQSAPSWEVSAKKKGRCVGSSMTCEVRNTSETKPHDFKATCGCARHVTVEVMLWSKQNITFLSCFTYRCNVKSMSFSRPPHFPGGLSTQPSGTLKSFGPRTSIY